MKKVILALYLSVALTGCTTVAQLAGNVAVNMSSTASSDVTTLAEAEQAATLLTKAADFYVQNGNPDKAALLEIQQLSNSVHAALVSLEATNAKGGSLLFGSFNAAISAFNAYATVQGISK